jgi:DNA primase
MGLDKETIQAIKERADIVQVIGERVRLSPAGAQFKALCPFHSEKTPSFTVNPQRRMYHCFGCGAGGSVIDFVMAYERLSFAEAAAQLAERLGIALGQGGAPPGQARELEALEQARQFYRGNLVKRPEGEAARRYLGERHFGEETWEAFSVGFALDDWRGWTEHAIQRGFTPEELLAAGLIRKAPTGRPYDLLRNRVVFPIADERRRCIAFGGRVIQPLDAPKYLNTPETRHYRKGRVLFGLAQGLEAIRKAGRALLVEGYLDVMRLHERGFGEAVATCGTALTAEHLELLARYAQKVLLVFDGDAAGMKAALRGAGLFLNRGLEAHVVTLPGGLDPDDFLLREGADAFRRELEQATPILEYLVQQTLSRHGHSISGRQRALGELAPLIGQIQKEATRDLVVRHLADLAGVRPEAILTLLPAPRGRAAAGEGEEAAAPGREAHHERMLLRILLNERPLMRLAREWLRPEEFGDPRLGQLFARLTGLSDEEYAAAPWDGLFQQFPEEQPLLRGLAVEPPPRVTHSEDWERVLRGEVARIKELRKARLLQRLKRCAGTEEEGEALRQLLEFRQELSAWKLPRQGYAVLSQQSSGQAAKVQAR